MRARRGAAASFVGCALCVLVASSCSIDAPVAERPFPSAEPSFESAAGALAATHMQPVLTREMLRGVTKRAQVALPRRARDPVVIEDVSSRVAVRFALEGMQDTRIEPAGTSALYRGAFHGSDVVHRVHAEGTEDFVLLRARPAREELVYDVDVSRVAGLRLVASTLELLDDAGVPRLRVAPPYVLDRYGDRHGAQLAVEGCAVDTSPLGPWGRRVTAPGASRCTVRVTWSSDIAYPATVDPAWSTTGSMSTPRTYHAASLLLSGKVLVAGGTEVSAHTSAELYDRASGTFAATGGMSVTHWYFTASTLVSGKVLIAAGDVASAELYDPAAGTFSLTGSPVTARRSDHTATVLPSGKVLVIGGTDGGGPYLATAELYDPTLGTFAFTGSMATGRRYHTATLLASGKVLVVGGNTSGGVDAELYDPTTAKFTSTGALGVPRTLHVASLLPSGKVLIAAGNQSAGAPASVSELYDPALGKFGPTGPIGTTRVSATASALGNGKVLVVGGILYPGGIAATELYDPVLGTFASAGSTAATRAAHTATVMASDAVLVAGGGHASAELYAAPVGQACVSANECASGVCADDHCCDKPCDGQCEACDVEKSLGVCIPVAGAPHPNHGARGPCAEGTTCNANRNRCEAPGSGAFTCDGQHTTTGADGVTVVDCAPYLCNAEGGCQQTCTSVEDCVAPAVCDAQGHCVPQPTESGGACALGPRVQDARAPLGFVLGAVLLVVRRRRAKTTGRSAA